MAPVPRARSSSISGRVWYLIIGHSLETKATRARSGAAPTSRPELRCVQTITLLHAPLRADVAWAWQHALLRALPYAKRLELERRDDAALQGALGGLALWI